MINTELNLKSSAPRRKGKIQNIFIGKDVIGWIDSVILALLMALMYTSLMLVLGFI